MACSFISIAAATTVTYPLSLHDALPIWWRRGPRASPGRRPSRRRDRRLGLRSEEHTSELQSREKLVCRLLLEKKKLKSGPARLQNLACHGAQTLSRCPDLDYVARVTHGL